MKKTEVPDEEGSGKKKPGAPAKTVRWGIHHAAMEFQVTPAFLSGRLKALGRLPSEQDQKYSTKDICAAVFGDIDLERARKIREDADGSALDNQRRRNELCDLPLVIKFCSEFGLTVKQHIMASTMDDKDKEGLIQELRDLFNARRITQAVAP